MRGITSCLKISLLSDVYKRQEPGKAAQSKSYMWLFRTSGEAKQQIILYDYQPDRKHTHPEEFLKDFSGYLHADGYEGYHKLPENITVIGCWAHMRRKLVEAMKALPKDKQADSNLSLIHIYQLLKYLSSKSNWRKNAIAFTKKYIDEGLRDRAITRNLDWGIDVPKDVYKRQGILFGDK